MNMDNPTKIFVTIMLIIIGLVISKTLEGTKKQLSIISATLFAGCLYLKSVTDWKWLVWVCVASFVTLFICFAMFILKIRIRTIRIAKFIGVYEEKTLIHQRGTSGYALYDENTGKITYISGIPGSTKEEYSYYAEYELPGGKTITLDLSNYTPPSSFYGSAEYSRREYNNILLCESGGGKIGTVKYNNLGRVRFIPCSNQTEAKKEFAALDKNAKGVNDKIESVKERFISWQCLGFLSVILINVVSVFLLRLSHYIITAYELSISNLPAGGFYISVPLLLIALALHIASFIVIPIALYKVYDEFDTLKVYFSALVGFPISYVLGIIVDNCFNKTGVYFGSPTNIIVIGSLITTTVFFTALFLIKYTKSLYDNYFNK